MTKKVVWKRISSRIAYKNPWLRVREDKVIRPDGSPGIYGVVEITPAVFIVPFVSKTEILLEHIYRYTIKKYSWELPSGNTQGKDPLNMARKELQEETGYIAKHWEKVGTSYSLNGVTTNLCHIYIASGLRQTFHNEQRAEGINKIMKIPIKKAFEMINSGKITDGETISALTIASLYLKLI